MEKKQEKIQTGKYLSIDDISLYNLVIAYFYVKIPYVLLWTRLTLCHWKGRVTKMPS